MKISGGTFVTSKYAPERTGGIKKALELLTLSKHVPVLLSARERKGRPKNALPTTQYRRTRMSLQFAEYLLTDLKDHFSKLTSRRYPLKWRISVLQLPGVCLKTSLFNNGDEIGPNTAIRMILETEVPDFEIEICLCNDKPGERELIALCFSNGAYLEHGIFNGPQGEKGEDPTEDALAYFQGVVDLLKGASLRQGPIKNMWLKIFQMALAAKPLDETRQPASNLA